MNENMDNRDFGYVQERPKRRRNRKKSFWRRLSTTIALALVFGMVSGGTFRLVNTIGTSENSDTAQSQAVNAVATSETTAIATSAVTTTGSLSVSDVAKKVLPSTVAINCTGTQVVSTMWGNAQQQYSSCGTGIIVAQSDEELLIATNNHVVADADTIEAVFVDDKAVSAVVKGTDSDNDLAVIAVQLSDIEQDTMNQISVADLGDFDEVAVGEQVVAIGNALGYGQSVTTGIVSALNRQVTTEETDNSYLLQTDAAINPGNSGGALVNMKGEVIGINSAKASSSNVEGMGYAIPINVASPILSELMTRKTRTTVDEGQSSWLGIQGQDLNQQVANAYHMPAGIYITEVVIDSPAQKAGLQSGDIMTSFDGTKVSTSTELKKVMSGYATGETVDVVVQRVENGTYVEKTLSVTLGHQQ